MKKITILALVLSLILAISVAGCNTATPAQSSSPSGTENTGTQTETDPEDESGGVVYVYNWGEYIDQTIFKDFEEETGIRVVYREFQNNEEMYSILSSGIATYDVIFPSDYMISRMIDEDMLEELDFSNIPNYDLIDDAYKNMEYDPDGKYSVAYMTGTVGLIYNSAMIDEEIDSWSALFDSAYEGQILMFDNSRDAFGIALKYLGYDQNTTDESEIREAYDLLVEQKPILQAYVMDQIFDKLESGEAAIGPYYAGDYLIMREANPDLVFVRPVEGTNVFVDAMCIPKGAANKANAELFINYMCDTDVAYQNMEFIWYASANAQAAEQFLDELDEEDIEIMFASEETLATCDVFTNLPMEINDLYNTLWSELKR